MEGRLAAPLIPQATETKALFFYLVNLKKRVLVLWPCSNKDSHDALLSRDAKQLDVDRETAVQKSENLSFAPNVGIQVESWSLKLCRVLPQRLMRRESPVRTTLPRARRPTLSTPCAPDTSIGARLTQR